MTDVLSVHNADGVIATGMGYLVGIHVSTASIAQEVTLYDHDEASGTKIFETYVTSSAPVTIFFATKFAPKYETGLYLDLGTNCSVVLWTRQYSVSS